MALTAISEEALGVVRRLNLSTELAVLERAWDTEIGALGAYARLGALDRKTLVVHVTSSAALQEITLRRKELVRRLNKHFLSPWLEYLIVRMMDGR